MDKTIGVRMMRIVKTYSAGFSLVELMVAVAVGTIVSLSMASLIADLSKGNAQVRANLDYVNFATEIKWALASDHITCDKLIGDITFPGSDPAVPVLIPSFDSNGNNVDGGMIYTARNGGPEGADINKILNTVLQLEKMELINVPNVPAPPVSISVGGVQTDFHRWTTKIRLVVKKRVSGADDHSATTMRPMEMPITLYTETATGRIGLCSTNDTASACREMGGVFVSADPNAIPPRPERCDILPAFGGCAKGGAYSIKEQGNSCTSANPYTGACSCPANYTAHTIARFPATKNATFVQKECLACTDNVNPVSDTSTLTPLISDEEEDAVDCAAQNARFSQTCQICRNAPPNDLKCGCAQGTIVDPRCSDPCHADMYGTSSFQCASARFQACNGDYSTPECQDAAQNYGRFNMCTILPGLDYCN
jgi:prepilin-type N-terminal cleavage/methylation domain-containing protein